MALRKKYPAKLSVFYLLVRSTPINFVKDPSQKSVASLINIIHPDDAPILAAALKSRVKFFITLDRKHFFTETLKQAKLPIKILTPREFIQKYLKEK